jgi:DNA polymerase-3 subunit alpha
MENKMTTFKPLACGFHSHTDASLDGGSTAASKIKQASKLGRIADCVTDHGVMSNLIHHHDTCKKLHKDKKIPNPIKSIHGIEAYIIDPHRPAKVQKNGKEIPQYYHLTIHFKTMAAYQYFCKLAPVMNARAVVKYGEVKPLMTFEELEPIAGQISIGSGCLIGPVQKNILCGRSDLAEKMYVYLRNLAGPGNFFVEVFPHIIDKDWQKPTREGNVITKQGYFAPITSVRDWDANAVDPEPCVYNGSIDIQKRPNEFVMMMAKKYGDPIIISLDDHFACEEDYVVQEARMSNGREDWKFYNSYHMYSSEECAKNLKSQLGVSDKQIEEWIDNSYKFVDLFSNYKIETSDDRWLLPTTEMVYNIKSTSTDKLNEIVAKVGKMPAVDHPEYQKYKDRFDYEVSVLRDNGVADFLPYFFVIEDVANYCTKNGVLFNVRGSAGGSLVLYLMGVSITNPFTYNLPFERFITLGRIKSGSLPDIDFDVQERDPVIQYLKDKYGDRMSLIATDLLMRLKSSILDVERAMLGYVRPETSKMCAMLKGAQQGQSDMDWLNGYTDKDTGAHVPGFIEDMSDPVAEDLRKYIKNNEEIWSTVLRCIGITKTRGVHAGGVIIAPEPIHHYMPTIETNKGRATAYNMKGVERVGGVKFDFLGVSTLHSLGISMKSIKEHEKTDLKWDEFPYQKAVYDDIINSDKLAAIFQLNTKLVRPGVSAIKPKNVQDLATITALYRPGALDSPSPDPSDPPSETAASYFVKCAKGRRAPYYIHDDLIPILDYTFGVIVFQEQSLDIFRMLVGYSYEQAEEVRRGIGKKDKDLLHKHMGALKEALLQRMWTEAQADRLRDSIMASARYAFNKSHSASYAIVAYNGCYIKHNWPLHFWKGELTVNSDNHDKLRNYFPEFKKYLLSISVIKSHHSDWLIEDGGLRPPLSLIKGCGAKSVEAIQHFIHTPLDQLSFDDDEAIHEEPEESEQYE